MSSLMRFHQIVCPVCGDPMDIPAFNRKSDSGLAADQWVPVKGRIICCPSHDWDTVKSANVDMNAIILSLKKEGYTVWYDKSGGKSFCYLTGKLSDISDNPPVKPAAPAAPASGKPAAPAAPASGKPAAPAAPDTSGKPASGKPAPYMLADQSSPPADSPTVSLPVRTVRNVLTEDRQIVPVDQQDITLKILLKMLIPHSAHTDTISDLAACGKITVTIQRSVRLDRWIWIADGGGGVWRYFDSQDLTESEIIGKPADPPASGKPASGKPASGK